ncbi:hypothetical protein F4804DRAFT_341762 [Jackrogersella minutella]|nr:hypothetical protein F4804DRAFT_341762 [Jackrogersella minutella]
MVGKSTLAGGGVAGGVRNASFVTHTIPDISGESSIVGLCTVPHRRAGMDDLGWHIADFLAFKALFRGETHHKGQFWLAQCDVPNIATANCVHGSDCRDVSGVRFASLYKNQLGVSNHRTDHIDFHASPQMLMSEFIKILSHTSELARTHGKPLIILVCGPASVEQDIFFGETGGSTHLKSDSLRRVLGEDIQVTVITPALFSAGWQVNPSFCRPTAGSLRADRTEFLAKQFGGVFAKEHVGRFLESTCPFVDYDQLSEGDKVWLGPPMLSASQKQLQGDLKVKIHSTLAGRFSGRHGDHSFDFEVENDDWEKLVGPRQHKPLSHYRKKWEELPVGTRAASDEQKFDFLGNAFGGNCSSQLNHLRHLANDSLSSWPGIWGLPIGRQSKTAFAMLFKDPNIDSSGCHELFNILEHRATMAVLADMTVTYLDLPMPSNQRCRDWNDRGFNFRDYASQHAEITKCIPSVHLPPGINENRLRLVQNCLDVPISYLAVALHHYAERGGDLKPMIKRTCDFLKGIKSHQDSLLRKDPEVKQMCLSWLTSISMPIRRSHEASPATKQIESSAQAVSSRSPGTRIEATGTSSTAWSSTHPTGIGSFAPQGTQQAQEIREIQKETKAEPASSSSRQFANLISTTELAGSKKSMPIATGTEKKTLRGTSAKPGQDTLLQKRIEAAIREAGRRWAEEQANGGGGFLKKDERKNGTEKSHQKDEAAKGMSIDHPEKDTSAAQPSVNQPILSANSNWVAPHLRHTVQDTTKPTEKKPLGMSSFRTSSSIMDSMPNPSAYTGLSAFTPHPTPQPAEENAEPERPPFIPPHLRHKVTGARKEAW